MKITVTPMGDVVIDTDDIEAAISFVNTLRNGVLGPEFDPTVAEALEQLPKIEFPSEPKKSRKPRRKSKHATSEALGDTYNWLYGYGEATPTQAGAGLDVTSATANYRLRKLVERNMAKRVGRGKYVAK